jgi:hypothetical protein
LGIKAFTVWRDPGTAGLLPHLEVRWLGLKANKSPEQPAEEFHEPHNGKTTLVVSRSWFSHTGKQRGSDGFSTMSGHQTQMRESRFTHHDL